MTPLERSIEIWTDRANGVLNLSMCPLCDEYRCGRYTDNIVLCPVEVNTGRGDCRGTPYWEYANAPLYSFERTQIAKRELRFLKTLEEPE